MKFPLLWPRAEAAVLTNRVGTRRSNRALDPTDRLQGSSIHDVADSK